ASGGYIGPVQRFATGGGVFRVPGEGYSDSVPAQLPVGSFVLRRAAAASYGGSALANIARGYASGGSVTPGEQFKELHELKVQAQEEFSRILDRASGLPHPSNTGGSFGGGQDVRDYVARVLDLIFASQDSEAVKALLERVLVYYNRFDPAIEDAQQFHVPLVMGAFSSGPEDASGPGALYFRRNAELTRGRRFAAGGSVDTVPAMLTPGEYVFSPGAVDAISRMYGGGYLPALNALRVPSAFLAGPRPPAPRVARFAEGGPVGYTASSTTTRAGAAALQGPTIGSLTIYTNKLDDRGIDYVVSKIEDRVRRGAGRRK
ncbi:MAG: hypothetical protein ABI831_06870, partial [Betaproteobacteria bacterium]